MSRGATLQTLTNAKEQSTIVTGMRSVPTRLGLTLALARVVTLAMAKLVYK